MSNAWKASIKYKVFIIQNGLLIEPKYDYDRVFSSWGYDTMEDAILAVEDSGIDFCVILPTTSLSCVF